MAARGQRPYLNDPEQYAYWKKKRAPLGTGTEVYNYASPVARELWYYLRSIGHVKHPPGWKCEHHGEDGFLLHVVHRGELWHETRRSRHVAPRTFRVKTGEACLLDLRHDVRYGVEGAKPAELYWAWMNGKDMPRVFLELGADQDPIFALRASRRLESLLRELQAITTREPAAYEVRSSALLTMILAELFACRADRTTVLSLGHTTRPLSESVRRGIDYITRFYDRTPRVKHIAEIAGQSLHYFSRRFHQEVGMSPIAYVNRYQIEQAKKFLVSSNHSIAQIARSVGFRNPRYFTRMFVRIVGITPVAYRKNPEKSGRSR